MQICKLYVREDVSSNQPKTIDPLCLWHELLELRLRKKNITKHQGFKNKSFMIVILKNVVSLLLPFGVSENDKVGEN